MRFVQKQIINVRENCSLIIPCGLCANQIETSTTSPPPPPFLPTGGANPRHLTIFCARGVGNLTFACVRWGKLNRKCQVSTDFFSRAPKLLTAIKHAFGRDGRDAAFVSDRLTKKVFIKYRRSRRYGRAFEHHFGPRGEMWTIQSSKVQMPGLCQEGGEGDVEVSFWSAHYFIYSSHGFFCNLALSLESTVVYIFAPKAHPWGPRVTQMIQLSFGKFTAGIHFMPATWK